jgi:hypothetical protein
MERMYKVTFCIILIFLFLKPAWADVFTLDVLEDAYINDFDNAATRDGIPNEIRNTNALLAGSGILSDGKAIESRAIMTFDLNSVLGQSLSKAELTGFGRRVDAWSNNEPITVEFSQYVGDGAVTMDDYSRTAAYLTGVSLPNSSNFSDYAKFTIDVTSAVGQALAANSRFLEFRAASSKLTGYITAGEVPAGFTPDIGRSGPQLQLTTVPEPCSVLLFSVGCGVLMAARKRRNKGV